MPESFNEILMFLENNIEEIIIVVILALMGIFLFSAVYETGYSSGVIQAVIVLFVGIFAVGLVSVFAGKAVDEVQSDLPWGVKHECPFVEYENKKIAPAILEVLELPSYYFRKVKQARMASCKTNDGRLVGEQKVYDNRGRVLFCAEYPAPDVLASPVIYWEHNQQTLQQFDPKQACNNRQVQNWPLHGIITKFRMPCQ